MKYSNPYTPRSNKGLNLAFPKSLLAWVMSSVTVMKLIGAELGHPHGKKYRMRGVKSGIIGPMKMQFSCFKQKQDKGEKKKGE